MVVLRLHSFLQQKTVNTPVLSIDLGSDHLQAVDHFNVSVAACTDRNNTDFITQSAANESGPLTTTHVHIMHSGGEKEADECAL